MTGRLIWDGLRMDIPAGMEATILDRGFARLVHADRLALDVRFGPEKARFDPDRDGRRLIRVSGMEGLRLTPFRPPRGAAVASDAWAAPADRARLFVLRFAEKKCVVAALFSAPPPSSLLRAFLGSLDWTPPRAWRNWRCFDLDFETPPHAALTKASFRPGAFRLEFALPGTNLIYERFAPASALLSDTGFEPWVRKLVQREHGPEVRVTPDGPDGAGFATPAPAWRRFLARLPFRQRLVRGRALHDETGNRILMLTERGRPVPTPDFERIASRYAATAIQG